MPTYRRTLWINAALLVLAVTISSHPVAASDRPPNDLPVAPLLFAPVPCGVEVQGTTYRGHGRHDWALDLNTTADTKREDVGLPILAQADGTVVWFKTSGYNKGAGTYIEVDYGEVTARYIHLVEGSIPERFAQIGAVVETGDQLGELGGTGRVSAPHLHLEYWDSADHADAAWYQLPRSNQISIYFESVEMVATVGSPSRTVSSTNCAESNADRILRQLRERRLTP